MDNVKIKGEIFVKDFDKLGNVIQEKHYNNLVLNEGMNYLLASLGGIFEPMKYFKIGVGIGNNEGVYPEQTSMENELFSKPISSAGLEYEFTGYSTTNKNRLLINAYFEADEGNFKDTNGNIISWKEIGLYAGNEMPDGTFSNEKLFNRALINEEKTDAIAKNITWIISIQ